MSTRCHIVVIEEDNTKHYIYHHSDGYPEGVGAELEEVLEACPSYDWETIMEHILAYDSQYEEDSGIHGDEEYIYEIQITNGGTGAIYECYKYDEYTAPSKSLIFTKIFPSIREELWDKYKTLEYKNEGLKMAFLDGVRWIEEFPTNAIIKKILTKALETVPDYSSDIEAWVKDIKERLKNGEGIISDS